MLAIFWSITVQWRELAFVILWNTPIKLACVQTLFNQSLSVLVWLQTYRTTVWFQVCWPWPSFQVTELWESQNFCSLFFLVKFSMVPGKIWFCCWSLWVSLNSGWLLKGCYFTSMIFYEMLTYAWMFMSQLLSNFACLYLIADSTVEWHRNDFYLQWRSHFREAARTFVLVSYSVGDHHKETVEDCGKNGSCKHLLFPWQFCVKWR